MRTVCRGGSGSRRANILLAFSFSSHQCIFSSFLHLFIFNNKNSNNININNVKNIKIKIKIQKRIKNRIKKILVKLLEVVGIKDTILVSWAV